jgi:hypothetical protein
MFGLIVVVAVLAVVWRLGYWPFDRSYTFQTRTLLPKYTESRWHKAGPTSVVKPGP